MSPRPGGGLPVSEYKDWLPSLLPAPLAGPWGRSFARILGLPVDSILSDAKDAVDQLGPADCPDDGLAAHGWARGIVQLSGETPDRYRRRLVGAWESWKQAGRKPSIRAALNGYGLHGVTVQTTAESPWGPSPEWAWFTVFVSGFVGAGEAEVGTFNVGEVHPDGAGLGIAPLIVGEFTVGQWVVGITARPATVASIRTAITTWKATRDRCAAVVFTWANTGAPHVALRGHATFDGGIMTATLTAVPKYDTGSLVIAENGELWSDDDGPAPFEPVFQRIADRLAFSRDALIGGLDWNGDISCAGGTSADFDITVGAINAIVCVTSGGTYHVLASAGATVTEAALEGGGSLAADSWYYLYAYRSGGGSLAYEISTTAPSASRRFKAGDTTRRYLGCVRTTAAGAPLAFEASRGQYRFRRSAIGSPNVTLRRLTRTSVGSATLDLVPRVPPHARCVDVRCTVALGAATSAALSVSTASTDAGYAEVLDGVAGGLARLSARLPVHHATVADASIFYDFSHDNVSDSTTSAELIVDGWVE
mgnify:CR=1 FL=1